MGRAGFCLPLALLFLASVIPSKAQSEAPVGEAIAAEGASAGAGAGGDVLVYDVRGNISLHCGLPNPGSLAYTWLKNNTDVESVGDLKDRYKLEQNGALFHITRSVEDDFGNYTCSVGGAERHWEVRGRPHVKLPANTNVVEGQKLKITCKVIGKPYPQVSWLYSNDTTEKKTFVAVAAALGGRAELAASEQGVPGGVLTLAAAARDDAGTFRCSAKALSDTAEADTTLRVKDMYAALWPFLGICAEVFVLCAIILVYERRRTKPEMDDSDVDNNDQKKS